MSLILVAGALLLMLFIVLAGAIDAAPVNKWYFLEATTSGIPGAPALTRWTYWNSCGVTNGLDGSCAIHAAYPLDPPSGRTFGTTEGVPPQFVGTRYYFLLTRFMFAFMLIALFFAACAFFTGILALCSRLASGFSGFLASIAMIFQGVQAALMTCVPPYLCTAPLLIPKTVSPTSKDGTPSAAMVKMQQ